MVTTEQVCQGAPWGPWQSGMVTECFSQVVILPALSLVIVIGIIYRLVKLRGSYFDTPFGRLNKLKIALCCLLALSYIDTFLAKLVIGDFIWFQLAGDIREIIVWVLCTVVIWLEMRSNHTHWWAVRAWWVLKFISIVMILQALAARGPEVIYNEFGHSYDIFIAILRLVLVSILAFLGLYVQGGKNKLGFEPWVERKLKGYGTIEPEPEPWELVDHKNAYETANPFSKLIFQWPSGLVNHGLTEKIEQTHLFYLPREDSSNVVVSLLTEQWDAQRLKRKPNLAAAILKTHKKWLIISGITKLTQDLIGLVGPISMRELIRFVSEANAPVERGLLWVAAFFCALVIASLASNCTTFIVTRISNQVTASITTLVYRKALKLSSSAKLKFDTGSIMNFMSIDANRLTFIMPRIHFVWTAPIQMIIVIYLLYYILGWSMLSGVAVLLLMIPVNGLATKKILVATNQTDIKRDNRTRLMNELLNGMRLVKFFNWESFFFERLMTLRAEELKSQKRTALSRAMITFFMTNTPLWVACVTFLTYTLAGNTLTADVAFTSLALFNFLRLPLGFVPIIIAQLIDAKLAIDRIQKFLLAENVDPLDVEGQDEEGSAVKVTNGTFKWNKDAANPTLHDISFKVKPGEVVAVVGSVGSGKSSLLAALIGEIHRESGRVVVNGRTAYVPQQAWIQNASVRDNILFGKPYNEARYQHCLNCCELMQDIQMLPDGDQTEIGEKGINLSGGQKQRISLARAMYQPASVFLFDAPLSAVDAHVGAAIFNNLIMTELVNTTRILVTHQLDILHRVDRIIVMRDGTISEMGTYEELIASGRDFADLVSRHVGDKLADQEPEEDGDRPGRKRKAPTEGQIKAEGSGKLIEIEDIKTGTISWSIYKRYIIAAGVFFSALTIFLLCFESALKISTDWWLAYWTRGLLNRSEIFYLGIYLALAAGTSTSVFIRSFTFVTTTIRAAGTIHKEMLTRVLHAPMVFFDTTPVGRILNRFSKDLVNVDVELPFSLATVLPSSLNLLAVVIVNCYVTPLFLVPLLPLSFLFYYVLVRFLFSSRQIQRIEFAAKSPIYALFSETLSGISTIRSFGVAQDFITKNDKRVDDCTRASFSFNGVERWLTFRMDFISAIVMACASLLIVVERGNIDPGMAGLSLFYSLQMSSNLIFLIPNSAQFLSSSVSVERAFEYVDLADEAPHYLPASVPPGWPHSGEIYFDNLKLRYRPNLDLVLKGITANIRPREKIGIVGRTGAGKSSLFLALFRTTEPASGTIRIDNIDITSVGLSTLRSRLSIIPQDPTLFMGTIRSNLDPYNSYETARIWSALAAVHMKNVIEGLEGGLESEVTENGDNFSVGQRQLLCLSRALLRNSRILLLDEATASVDMETDRLIQDTIRERFKDSTVLTIAHRIHTILDYHRVIVMDAGVIVEFDTPDNLRSNTSSIFYSLLQEANRAQKAENENL